MKRPPRARLAIGLLVGALVAPVLDHGALASPAAAQSSETGLVPVRQELALAADASLTVTVEKPDGFAPTNTVVATAYQAINSRGGLTAAIEEGPRRSSESVDLDPTAVVD